MKLGTTDIKNIFLGTTEVKKIFSGTTLLYEKVLAPQGETWVINENADFFSTRLEEVIDFESNSTNYSKFFLDTLHLKYDDIYAFNGKDYQWTNQAYRTVIFETAPTGDLLTWLQANAVKQ